MKNKRFRFLGKLAINILVLMVLVLPFVVRWSFVEAQTALFLTANPSTIITGQTAKIKAKIGEGFGSVPLTKVIFISSAGAKIEPSLCTTGANGSCEVNFSAVKGGDYNIIAKYADNDGNFFTFPSLKITVQSSYSVTADKTTITNDKIAIITAKGPADYNVSFNSYGDSIIDPDFCIITTVGSCSVYFSSVILGDYAIDYEVFEPFGLSVAKGKIIITVVASTTTGGTDGGTGTSACKAGEKLACVAGEVACKADAPTPPSCQAGEYACKAGELVCKADLEQTPSEGVNINVKLINPIKADRLDTFIKDLLNIILTIGVPIVALAIIYSGFLFVKAQGKEEDLKKAKETFFYTIIGAAILLGAWVLAQAIKGTIEQIGA